MNLKREIESLIPGHPVVTLYLDRSIGWDGTATCCRSAPRWARNSARVAPFPSGSGPSPPLARAVPGRRLGSRSAADLGWLRTLICL